METVQQFADKCAKDFVNFFHQPIKPQEWSNMDDDSLDHTKRLLEMLDSFQECFKNAVRRIIVPHLRQRNASLPMSKLPVELMQRIFHTTLFWDSGERYGEYMTTFLALRSVSEAWRDLINKTPTFWTHLSSEDHPSFISKAFEISGSCPLHLTYTGHSGDGFVFGFFDQALARLHCWESVSLHDPDLSDLQKYFTHPAPRLKKIHLAAMDWWESPGSGYLSLFGGSWESVEVVHVSDFGELDWSGVQCRSLRILEIDSCANIDLAVMIGMIRENQHLEVLKLRSLNFAPQSSLLPPARPPIVLPHLRALTLFHLYFRVGPDFDPIDQDFPALQISRNIRFPHCTDFLLSLSGPEGMTGRIDLEYLTTPPPSSPDVFSLASLADALSAADSLVVSIDSPNSTLKTNDAVLQRIRFCISLRDAPPSFFRSWVGDVVARKPGEPHPEMRLLVSIEPYVSELAGFKECQAVTELSVHRYSRSTQEIQDELLRLLATPYTSSSGATRIPFPSLRRINAWACLWDANGDAILDVIRTRFGAPGVEANVPETIVVESEDGEESFTWPNLDGIGEMHGFSSITFIWDGGNGPEFRRLEQSATNLTI